MLKRKFQETDGVKVYTPIKTWSKERKKEYAMREWSDLNES